MTLTGLPGIWVTLAECGSHTNPNLWFPEGHPSSPTYKAAQRKAIAICAECPVVTDCLAYANEHRVEEGIWGGLTPSERRRGRGPRITAVAIAADACCLRCGKVVGPRANNPSRPRMFCDTDCRFGPKPVYTCKTCGQEFTRRHRNGLADTPTYCSKDCWRNRKERNNPVVITARLRTGGAAGAPQSPAAPGSASARACSTPISTISTASTPR